MPVSVEVVLNDRVVPSLNAAAFADLIWWTKATLYEWANEAVQRMARRAAGLVETATSAVTVGEGSYALPARTLSVLHVSAVNRSLAPANVRDLEARDDGWRSRVAVTIKQYVRQDQGLGAIRIYPKPDTGVSGSVRATVHRAPAAVTEGAPVLAGWPEVLGGYVGLRVIERARASETDAKMPESAAIAAEICGIVEQAAAHYWGEVA